jgi:hypothetical protein
MRILCNILVVLFVTATAVGQQINPVPDYIFRNSMSVGRNAPTDTSAYFSIGPRFGATRGFMPPMVVDTAAVTGTKRNGLLIYSIQRNSFLYWDSTGSRWSRIAANLDTLLLSTRAWRQKGDDSLAAIINTRTDTVNRLSTKAWRQKGIDSVASVRIGGSGVTGRIPKFTASQTLDSSQIIQSGGRIGIGTVSAPITKVQIEAGGGRVLWVLDSAIHQTSANTNITVENHFQDASGVASIDLRTARFGTDGTFGLSRIGGVRSGNGTSDLAFSTSASADNPTERMRITSAGESLFGTTTDAGDYRVQIAGGLYNTTNAALAVSSGSVTVGTTSTANYKLNVEGNTRILSSDTTGTLVVRGKPDVPNIGGSPGFGGGYVVFAENAASGYANLQIGGLSNSPYSIYIQANNGSVVQDISMQPLGGNVGIGTLASAPSEKLHVIGNGLFSGSIKTGAPAGGTAATWKLGIVVAGSYTAASNYLQVDVGGTLYYIGLVTPN